MGYVDEAFTLGEGRKLPYYHDLEKISAVMQSMYVDFPFDFCNLTARVVSIKTGLIEVGGEIRNPDLQRRFSDEKWHTWNIDSRNGLNICLTLYQYNFRLPNISIYPKSTEVFEIKEVLTQIQRQADLGKYGLDNVLSELEKV